MATIRAEHTYNETAQNCVPEAITCALESESFEDALRNAVSLGGDADTLPAIAGQQAWRYVPSPMHAVITDFYAHYGNIRHEGRQP